MVKQWKKDVHLLYQQAAISAYDATTTTPWKQGKHDNNNLMEG